MIIIIFFLERIHFGAVWCLEIVEVWKIKKAVFLGIGGVGFIMEKYSKGFF